MLRKWAEQALDDYQSLIVRLNQGALERGENDLTRPFLNVLEALGLYTILDSGQRTSRRKRPDILAYLDRTEADLAYPAEIVGETKKPSELRSLGGSLEAALTGQLWTDKVIPYVRANAAKIQYFVLTTLNDMLVVRITSEIRQRFIQCSPDELTADTEVKALFLRASVRLPLTTLGTVMESPDEWRTWHDWIVKHFSPDALQAFPLLERANSIPIDSPDAMEDFALTLARLVAGPSTGAARGRTPATEYRGIFEEIQRELPEQLRDWHPDVTSDLLLYIMSVNPSLDLPGAQRLANTEFRAWRDSFIAASIHSLVSRLVVLKIIEDRYCLHQETPLVERELWALHTGAYEGKDAAAVLGAFRERLERLRQTRNPVLHGITVFGGLFNWIEGYLDPTTFVRLLELFVVHDFAPLAGDLLGRFYEMYAQQVNRTQRKALGQYFTPLPIVEYMWAAVWAELRQTRVPLNQVEVLDPATGSATFLVEAARRFGTADVPEFWTRLVGFDISPQGQGIAQANLYMAILSQVLQDQAHRVRDLRLYTTDALDPGNANYLGPLIMLLTDPEQRAYIERQVEISREIKRASSFRVVIGNPPYRGFSRFALSQMAARFPRLLSSSSAAARAQQSHIRDDYAWFFAASDYYLEHRGLLCFITSDTYTRLRSYRDFRRELLRHFRVITLVRLGATIFPDVSPRTHFAITLLEKRVEPLADAESSEPFVFYDLAPLTEGVGLDNLAGPNDPRFLHLVASAREMQSQLAWGGVSRQESHPTAEREFSFLPLDEAKADVREQMQRDTISLFPDRHAPNRIFKVKWPGIITAFGLLHDHSREALMARMQAFFELCATFPQLSPAEQERRIADFAHQHRLENQAVRVQAAVALVNAHGLTFDPAAIKRSVCGTLGPDVMWYPDSTSTWWVYYEPRFRIERPDQPEGKARGWGSQSQWRDPASHLICPKLIYTTSTNPSGIAAYGYRAFVVDDEWFVRLAGATSQQFNYTGLDSPEIQAPHDMFGSRVHSNLTEHGLAMVRALEGVGGTAEDLLFYIAAIYNSELAAEFHAIQSGEGLGIKRITSMNAAECLAIARLGRRLRNLHRLLASDLQFAAPGQHARPALDSIAPTELLHELGAEDIVATPNSLYRAAPQYLLPATFWERVRTAIEGGQGEIDELVETLYE